MTTTQCRDCEHFRKYRPISAALPMRVEDSWTEIGRAIQKIQENEIQQKISEQAIKTRKLSRPDAPGSGDWGFRPQMHDFCALRAKLGIYLLCEVQNQPHAPCKKDGYPLVGADDVNDFNALVASIRTAGHVADSTIAALDPGLLQRALLAPDVRDASMEVRNGLLNGLNRAISGPPLDEGEAADGGQDRHNRLLIEKLMGGALATESERAAIEATRPKRRPCDQCIHRRYTNQHLSDVRTYRRLTNADLTGKLAESIAAAKASEAFMAYFEHGRLGRRPRYVPYCAALSEGEEWVACVVPNLYEDCFRFEPSRGDHPTYVDWVPNDDEPPHAIPNTMVPNLPGMFVVQQRREYIHPMYDVGIVYESPGKLTVFSRSHDIPVPIDTLGFRQWQSMPDGASGSLPMRVCFDGRNLFARFDVAPTGQPTRLASGTTLTASDADIFELDDSREHPFYRYTIREGPQLEDRNGRVLQFSRDVLPIGCWVPLRGPDGATYPFAVLRDEGYYLKAKFLFPDRPPPRAFGVPYSEDPQQQSTVATAVAQHYIAELKSVAAPTSVAATGAPGGNELADRSVVLQETGPDKLRVIALLRQLTGIGLKEAKDIAREPPSSVIRNVTMTEAERIVQELGAAGASASIE